MSVDTSLVVPQAVWRKTAWRIVPLLFALYVIAYLDRANLSFAKLRTQPQSCYNLLSPSQDINPGTAAL